MTKPAAWRYRYRDGGKWTVVESEDQCNTLPAYEREPLFARPESARGFYTKQGVYSVDQVGVKHCTDCNRVLRDDGTVKWIADLV